jgi:hypothetical protein
VIGIHLKRLINLYRLRRENRGGLYKGHHESLD